ncbi:hypothetical protein CRUP_030088, partial [Coryphaenoides rupestris]
MRDMTSLLPGVALTLSLFVECCSSREPCRAYGVNGMMGPGAFPQQRPRIRRQPGLPPHPMMSSYPPPPSYCNHPPPSYDQLFHNNAAAPPPIK